jgi:MFS family permease
MGDMRWLRAHCALLSVTFPGDGPAVDGNNLLKSRAGGRSVAAQLGALVTCALLVVMQLYVGIPLAPVVADDLGAGGAAGALTTSFSLAYAVGFVAFGTLSDHYGRKVVLVPGLALLAASTAAVSLAPSLEALTALRAIQGLSAASFPAVAIAYCSEALPRRLLTTAIGALSTAFLVAGIAGQVYASAVTDTLNWRWGFAVAAVAFALAVPVLGASLSEPRRIAPALTLGHRFRRLAPLAARRELALPYAAGFTLLLSFVAMYTALGPELAGRFGLGSGEVLLVRLAGLPGMLLAPLAGVLAGRFGAARVAVAGFSVAALGLVCEALAGSALWALIGATGVFVAGIATTVPAAIALITARAGDARGAGTSLYSFAAFLGASAGPLLTGLGLGFASLLVVLAAALAVAAALVTLSGDLDPDRGKQRPAGSTGGQVVCVLEIQRLTEEQCIHAKQPDPTCVSTSSTPG